MRWERMYSPKEVQISASASFYKEKNNRIKNDEMAVAEQSATAFFVVKINGK